MLVNISVHNQNFGAQTLISEGCLEFKKCSQSVHKASWTLCEVTLRRGLSWYPVVNFNVMFLWYLLVIVQLASKNDLPKQKNRQNQTKKQQYYSLLENMHSVDNTTQTNSTKMHSSDNSMQWVNQC